VFDGSKSVNPNGGEMSYSWNFGNGETASGKTAKYIYKYPGHYIAALTISSGSYQNSDQAEVLIYPAGIYVSEFIPNPDGSDEENEWIEIANDSDSIADISDFQLGDGSSAIFKIPKNTYIVPRSFLVFSRNAAKISLNNDEDKVVLYYPSGEIADSVKYEDGAKEGFSAARTSTGGFLWTKNLTPGTANIFLSETAGAASAAPAKKIVSENKSGELKIVSAPRFSVARLAESTAKRVGGQSNGDLISFLPEASAKTVDGYDEVGLAEAGFSAEGGKADSISNQSASLAGSLKNNSAAAFILISSIILAALAFVFRRKFWK
ncbi:MAG: lamin tail domain-containing protein, partial [Patescibacteria group bacterium]